jgi:ubiquinone/menaquinone biosynthesis C-methylase UbiE
MDPKLAEQVVVSLLDQVEALKAKCKQLESGSEGAEATNEAPPADNKPAVKGEVQKAFDKGTAPALETTLPILMKSDAFKTEFGGLVDSLSPHDIKICTVKMLKDVAARKIKANPAGTAAKRAGTLKGYRGYAEKKGIHWSADAGTLAERGTDTWEKERAAIAQPKLKVPTYYAQHGQGTLHSYAEGNCNWEAAFDAPSAYLLVHLHHFPDRSPQLAFEQLHEEMSAAAIPALGNIKPAVVYDLGCGVGTSSFAARKSLNEHGFPSAQLIGVDLSSQFIAVGQYRLENEYSDQKDVMKFIHGDALNLSETVSDGSVDMVYLSEVTHEMPKAVTKAVMAEIARILAPGGVLAYLDLNPMQILNSNTVAGLVERIAMQNEPYFDEYLEVDMPQTMEDAGLEVVTRAWPNAGRYENPDAECSLRILVARKRAA